MTRRELGRLLSAADPESLLDLRDRSILELPYSLVRPWMVGSRQEKALFVSHRGGGQLPLRSVSRIVLNAARASGVTRRITPHSFAPRHGHASAP